MVKRPVGRPRKDQSRETYSNGLMSNGSISQVMIAVPTMAMTVEQAAKELHISRTVAYRLTKEEGFPVFNIGRSVLVNRKMLQEWMDKKTLEHSQETEQETEFNDETEEINPD